MVRDQCPSVALGLGFLKDSGKTTEERFTILVVFKDFSTFDPPGHYMLQDTWGIKSGLARHVYLLFQKILKYYNLDIFHFLQAGIIG